MEEETVENRFGFAGEMMDAVTGQYYLRARFYNPVIARFLSEDTYYGDGLNLYAYCHNNPVRYVDPSGHEGLICSKKYGELKKKEAEEGTLSEKEKRQIYEYEQNQKKSNGAGSDSKSGIDSRYYNPDGSPIWPPNRGFDGNPTKITLESGTLIDRYGYDGGTFVSPKGIPYTERSLPLGTDKKPYTVFEVVKPIEVQAGKIAPWFGEKGGGIQYEFSQKISELLEQGILRKVQY